MCVKDATKQYGGHKKIPAFATLVPIVESITKNGLTLVGRNS